MATPAELARQRQLQQQAIARAAAQVAAEAWADVDPADIARSWAAGSARAVSATSGAQLLSATGVDDYVDEVLQAAGDTLTAAGRVNARAFAGIASDGRALETLLYQPAITSLQAIAAGAPTGRALAIGGAHLDMIVRTQVADAGRAATGAAVAARGCGYTRQLTPPSCSRCAVLAGKFYRWNAGFQRHPRCDCIHVPCTPGFSKRLTTSPRGYFDSLSPAAQDRIFTQAGARAIRDGADIGQVVNARRGMQTAGGRRITTESTTRSGVARRGRLMPEQIYADAKTRDEAVRALRENGYIAGQATTAAAKPQTFAERLAEARTGEAAREAATLSRLRTRDLMSSDELRALYEYTGMTYGQINRPLRAAKGVLKSVAVGEVRQQIRLMDRAMRRSPLTADVVLYRGVGSGRAVFGEAWDRSLVGGEWTEYAYVSTSSNARQAQIFANSQSGAQIRIVAGRGVHGIELSGDDAEAEVLLERGLRLRVVADTGPGSQPRKLDVEVLAR